MGKAGTKAMTKGGIAASLAEENELKPKQTKAVMESLAAIATAEVKKAGKFVIPGVCMIKTRHKPATKAGMGMAFGQEMKVKAKPARTIVKAFPVAAIKAQFKRGPRLRGSPRSLKAHVWSFRRSVSRGNPTVRAWKVSMRALGHLRCPFCTCGIQMICDLARWP